MNTDHIKEEEFQREEKASSTVLWMGEIGSVKLEENGQEEEDRSRNKTLTAEIDEELASSAAGDHPSAVDNAPDKNGGIVLRPNRNGKQKGARWERQKWLQNRVPYTYTELIAMAINSQPDQRATLAEIYEYLRVNFDCFRGPYTGWKNCIRHTLTLAKSFHKVPRAERAGRAGLGNYWTLSDYFHRRNLSGALGRRSRKTEVREMPQDSEEAEAVKHVARSVDEHQNAAASIHWEQQQSNDVEDLLRRIGIPPKVNNTCGRGQQQKAGDRDTAHAKEQHRLRQPPPPAVALSQVAPPFDTTGGEHNKAKRSGGGGGGEQNKLDLLIANLRTANAKCLLPLATSVPSSSSAVVQSPPPLPSRHPPTARQIDRLLTHNQPFSSTLYSLASSLIKSDDSSLGDVQQPLQMHQQKIEEADDEEVITVDEDDSVEAEEWQQHCQQQRQDLGGGPKQQQMPFRQKHPSHSADGPSVAAVAQVSAWLGLVAGEMRLRLQCDGKSGSMVLSSNYQGRAVHRLQFVPGNDRELLIRQFTGDQLYQEKRWTWHAHQEEQTLHAIRGICFHFFFCA